MSQPHADEGVVQVAAVDKAASAEALAMIKELTEDVEIGKIYDVTVDKIMNFGAFCKITSATSGLVHVSEIAKEKTKTPAGQFKVGDVINAKVMNVNVDERRIGLSIKALEMESDQEYMSDYINNMRSPTSEFGEILRDNLQGKLNDK